MEAKLIHKILNANGICEVTYRKKKDPSFLTWANVSADLGGAHIQNGIKHIKRKLKPTEILLWNWRYDSPLILDISQIAKVTPVRLEHASPL
jgi:hypothetical protein